MVSARSKKRDSARMQVRRYVMDLIYQYAGEAVRLPSNKDLADELGIARSTAQLELKLLLKEGFLETRRGVGTFTVPRIYGNTFQVPLIGILDGDGKIIYEPFYRVALKAHVSMALARLPMVIQEIRLFSERENDLFEELRSIRCDALVCIAPSENQTAYQRRLQKYRPVITVDCSLDGIPGMELERVRKGRVLGEALLAEGRKRVLFAQNDRYRATTFRGCREVFAEAGFVIPEKWFFENEMERLEEFLSSGFRPQAVAPGLENFDAVVALLRKYGIDLNEECRMVTFMYKPENMPEPVMLFDFPFEEFGRQVAAQVVKRLADPSLPPERTVFDFHYKKCTI